jgi:DNA-binding transcriptional MerR regulator
MDISPRPLDGPDAELVSAVSAPPDDLDAPYDLAAIGELTGAAPAVLQAVVETGLLLPHHVDDTGTARYSAADLAAVRAGLELLDAGLPLAELIDLAGPTDAAVRGIAEQAVEGFLRFVRDPALGDEQDGDEVAGRLVTAYERMLPASVTLVAHHFRRHLLRAALARVLPRER